MGYRIVTDTSANLPTKYLEENNIAVLPFTYIVNGVENQCLDTDAFELEADEYYEKVKKGVPISTSQVTPQAFVDCFEEILKAGDDVLYIGMSSGISGAYQSSTIATAELADQYPDRKIITIDTKAASLGEGIPVMRAVEKKNEGADIDEVAEYIRKRSMDIAQVFVVDDLMHLRHTGRLTGAAAVIGTVLNIKPVLKGNENGQIVNIAKCKGKKQAIVALAKRYEKYVRNAADSIVGIAYTTGKEDALYLVDLLNEIAPPKELLLVRYEPVTGSHVGEGTVALFFESEYQNRLE